MAHRKLTSGAQKMTAPIKAIQEKLGKMRMMESERKALAEYKNILSITWCDLAGGEAVCAEIYAFAYIPDKTTVISQLETARANSRLAVNSPSPEDLINHKGTPKSIPYPARGRNAIKGNEPDYDTDTDVSDAPKEVKNPKMQTKALRGKSPRQKTGERVSYGPENVRTTNEQNKKTDH